MKRTLFPLLALLMAAPAHAGWIELTTDRFRIYAPVELAEYAAAVSRAAESLTPGIAARYGYTPRDLTVWVLHDDHEWSNGGAYTDLNHIELDGTTSEFELRGTGPWTANVVAHEFAHLSTLNLTRRFPRWIGGVILEGADDLGRTGRGRATGAYSFLIPSSRVPRWFSEGIAQYEAAYAGVDAFDSTRQMIERMAWAEGGLLSLAEMASVADKTYLSAEQVYNQGFSWVLWLASEFGDARLADLLRTASSTFFGGFPRALETTYGLPATALEQQWRRAVAARALTALSAQRWVSEGTEYMRSGAFVRQAALSPDGGRIAYMDEGDADYPNGRLVLASTAAPQRSTEVGDRFFGTPTWSNDGSFLIATRVRELAREGRETFDLVRIDAESAEARWITRGGRLAWPALHPDGRTIAASMRMGGGWNLVTMTVEGKDVNLLTDLPWGWEIRESAYAADGTLWAIVGRDGHLDLAHLDPQAPATAVILDWPGEEHSPRLDTRGRVWFSSDRTGIRQLYVFDPETGLIEQRTGALGAAMDPAPAVTEVVFTVYHHAGFRLHRMPIDDADLREPAPATWTTVTLPRAVPTDTPPPARARFRVGRTVAFPLLWYYFGNFAGGAAISVADETLRHQLDAEVLAGRLTSISLAYTWSGFREPLVGIELDRYLRTADIKQELTDGSVIEVPLRLTTDRVGVHVDYNPSPRWILRSSASWDRRTLSLFDNTITLLEGPRVGQYAGWIDASGRTRNDIDFRGSRADLSVAGVFTRAAADGASAPVEIRTDHLQIIAGATRALGSGPITIEGALDAGWMDRDVYDLDECFLGGTFFGVTRGELRCFRDFPGYGDFSLHGESFALAHAATRLMLMKDIGSAGPLLADALVLEIAANAGNAWPHSVRPRDLWRAWVRGNLVAAGPRPDDPDMPSIDPLDPRYLGLLFDIALDIKLKSVLYDAYPWNSFVRVAHGFQDPKGEGWPVRLYFGIGTGF